MEILEKPKIVISKKMDAVAKKMKEECKGNEFLLYILSPKDNPFKWVEAAVPVQEVTGVSVNVKKNGKMSEYEKIFLAYMNNEKLRCVGTFHHHPCEGFSSIDDGDLNNHACYNTTHGLPFIDITMDTEEDYYARAVIKIGQGENRQLFQIECDYEMEEDIEENGFNEKIEKIAKNAKTLFKEGYKINEKKLKEAITPEVDVSEFLTNIKTKKYEEYANTKIFQEGRISASRDLGLSRIKWNLQFNKNRRRFIVDVINDIDENLMDELEGLIAADKSFGKILDMEPMNDGLWRATLYCGSKKESKRLRRAIYEAFVATKEEVEDYLGCMVYAGGGAYPVGYPANKRDSCAMYGFEDRIFY